MSSSKTHISPDPLGRFVEIYERLEIGRGWWESAELLRHSALALTSIPGDSRALAQELTALAEELKDSQPWWRRSSVGVLLAAQLLRTGTSVAEMQAEVARAGALFRERWRFSGGTEEVLAILALAEASGDGRVSREQFTRMVRIWDALKKDHPILTQKSDWPLCAILSQDRGEPESIARRVEEIYQGLHALGYGRNDELQTASLVLFLQGDPAGPVCARFHALYGAFKASGLWMGTSDYDDVALLCFAPEPPAKVVGVVEHHRARIAELSPKPGKQTSFALAAGTAQLELLREASAAGRIVAIDAITRIVAVLAAQRAAATAAAAAS
ncbi:MAG: DUF4003 family protein [Planctomycetota bacterium]|nr:DUF4003 family protein [Planctomycetota bacterium]